MSSIGRGRGWGKSPIENPGALRRPGKPLPPTQLSKSNDTDYLIQKIEALNVNNTGDISSISIFEPLDTPEPLDLETETRFKIIVKKTLTDRDFAAKFILALKHNFVTKILNFIQPHYNDRGKLPRPQYLNFVYFLSEIYHKVRSTVNTPIKAIELAVIECYQELIESGVDEEIKLAVMQITLNGKMLHTRRSLNFLQLMIAARRMLIVHQLSSQSRGLLMLIIDLYNQKFIPISDELQTLYTQILGPETFSEVQNNLGQIWVSNDRHHVTVGKDVNEDILKQFLTNQTSPPKNSHEDISIPNNSRELNNSGPRAIRGCGAVENKDFHKNDRKFSEKKDRTKNSSRLNDGNNKSWHHDDRFSKDY